MRRIQAGLAKGGCIQVRVEVPEEVATYLLNQKRAELFRLEKQYCLKIQIAGQLGLPSHEYNVEFSRKEPHPHPEKGQGKPAGAPTPPGEKAQEKREE